FPKNYDFEIPKTIWKIRSSKSKRVALQFPEGLLVYSCAISSVLQKYTGCETVIMGDVTYGACCIDDYTARTLGCTLLVHYGHSCLVPIQDMEEIDVLYVFVNIDINLSHFVDTFKANFDISKKVALVTTIQFVVSLQAVKKELSSLGYSIEIPQCKPLSPGEILGCTSPKVSEDVTSLIFLGDGRFHLESVAIRNPTVKIYQYNPYSKKLTHEEFAYDELVRNRITSIEKAKKAKKFGLIQGTLGRQGNRNVFEVLENKLTSHGKEFIRVLLSEITPQKLALFEDVECWVQVACPRISLDWGNAFSVPLLTPYELMVVLDEAKFISHSYPMDNYAYDSAGPWTNNHPKNRSTPVQRRKHVIIAST
uniref:2-(3-amino-3-carboxypropyl)histidine synthase subunit 1 n=1 Tax=Syphacia muris TaxID=451379 RepID=A0A0N5ATK5_9BILA